MVYFIQSVSGGPIKIGKADNPEKRLLDLQTGSPVVLRILGCINGDEKEERSLHIKFADERLYGEWFAPSEKLISYLLPICSISPQQNNVDPTGIYVGATKAAEIIGLKTQTLANWRFQRRGPEYVKAGGAIRYRVDDLVGYMEKRKVCFG